MRLAELLVGVAGLLLLLEGIEGVVIRSYHPSNGPTRGGTEITIRGEGFITTGNSRSKCNFQRTDLRGVVFSQLNQIHNSTLITCILPLTNFFTSPLPPEGVNVRLVLTAGPGMFSDHVEFLVYDISSILIISVSPTEALTNSSNGTHILVQGQGFIDTGEITCALDAQNATMVPAMFINSSSLVCNLPMVQFASRIRLVVSLNGQPAGAILSLADIFTFYSPPPLVVSSYFSSSYVEIFILFDREIEIGSEAGSPDSEFALDDSTATLSLDCSQVLDGDAVSLLGSTAACSWLNSQQRTIVLRLSSQSAIREHTHLGLNSESLRTRGVLYSRLAGGGVEVISLPGVQLVPMAILEGPTTIPRCGELVISGERSLYGGARALQYQWVVGMEVGVAGGVVQDPALQEYIPVGFSVHSELRIPSTAFYSDSTVSSGSGSGGEDLLPLDVYAVQLVVRNYFGYTSLAVSHNVTTARHLSPSVVIVGGSTQRIRPWKEVLLEGKVLRVANECALEFQVASYSWSLGSELPAQQLQGVRTNLSVLLLPPNALQPGTSYVATFTVTFHTGSLSTSHVSIESEEVLEARIAGGVRRALGVEDRIDLDGRSSLIHHHPTANLSVAWSCVTVSVPELSQANASCENFTGSDSILHSVGGESLPPGGYEFTLMLFLVGGRRDGPTLQSSATQLLVLFPDTVPRVEIMPTQRVNVDSVLIHRKFSIGAEVSSLSEGRVQWTVEYVEGYGLLQLRANISRTSLQYPICSSLAVCPQSETSISLYTTGLTTDSPFRNQLSLVLRDSLLLPRNSYRFKVSVTDISGRVGFAEMDIRTESIPTLGRIEVSPATGWPLSTLFSLRTLGWTDEMGGAPYLYRIGFRYLCSTQSNGVCEEWLTGVSGDNDFTFWLPDVDSVLVPEVLVRVSDRNGAVQDITQTFSSLITSHSNEDKGMSRLTALIEEAQTLIAGGNWVQGLGQLTSLLSSLDLDHGEIICNASQTLQSPKFRLTNGDSVSLKTRVLPIVLNLYFTFIPCSQTHYQIILSLLQKVTRTQCRTGLSVDTSWTQADTDGLLGVLESIISKFNQFSESGIISRRGFSAEDVRTILSIYEQTSHSSEVPSVPVDPLLRVGNNITMELSRVLPDISYGLCVRQSIHEEDTAIDLADFVNMKSSLINLPPDYITGGCRGFRCTFEPVRINFGETLLSTFLQWNCSANGRNLCSGVCLTSSLFHVDLLWQGREFSSLLKTPLLHLSLQNPSSGAPLDVHLSTKSGTVLTFPIISPYSSASNLHCVVWDPASLLWLSGPCATEVVMVSQQYQVLCRCSDVGTLFYAVLERCPSGHYGQTCSQICPQGLWGLECRESCDCSNRGTCSAVDGSCDCDPGWTGMRCADVCPQGSYGRLCGEACRCQNGATCDHVTGGCGCTAGWIGLLCNISCMQGFYGDGCARSCECRNASECDHITGACTCQAGFTGATCQDPCPSGSHGLACASTCQCSDNGTRSCDPISGSCDCQGMWTGLLCDIQVTTPPPPPTVPVPPSFQIWWAIVGVFVALVAVVGVAIVLIVVFVWRKRKRKKVLPVSTSVSKGDAGKDDASSHDSSDMSDEFVISRTKSLEVLVPPGKSLKDVFFATSPVTEKGAMVEFKEPLEMHGKFRWQIVRVLSEGGSEGRKSDSLMESSRPVSQIQKESKEVTRSVSQAKEESENQEKEEASRITDHEVQDSKGSQGSEVQEEKEQGSKVQEEGKGSQGSEVQNGKEQSKVKEEGNGSQGSDVQDGKEQGSEVQEGKESQDSKVQGSEVQQEEKESQAEAPGESDRVPASKGQESETENGKEKDTLSQHEQTELAYNGGVYLPLDATLKDLRNKFVDSEQLQDHNDGVHFQFLLSDVPGDRIELDTEDEVLLCQIESSLVQRRTLYIETIDPSLALGELCVCGRFADLECTSCRRRGYCGKSCQENDWPTHEDSCRKVSSRRERRQQRRRSRDQARRFSSRSNPPLSEDTCVCGKEAEYECSGCRKQGYCSLACQREDWNFHDYYCRQPGSSNRDRKHHSYTPISMQRGKLQTVFEEPESSIEATS